MIKRTLVKLAAVIAAMCAAGVAGFGAVLVVGYPIEVFLPRQYNWLAVPFFVGAILPLMFWAGFTAHNFVKRLMARNLTTQR